MLLFGAIDVMGWNQFLQHRRSTVTDPPRPSESQSILKQHHDGRHVCHISHADTVETGGGSKLTAWLRSVPK